MAYRAKPEIQLDLLNVFLNEHDGCPKSKAIYLAGINNYGSGSSMVKCFFDHGLLSQEKMKSRTYYFITEKGRSYHDNLENMLHPKKERYIDGESKPSPFLDC